MATTTEFRKELQRVLKEAFEFEFIGGPVTDAQENRDLGCIWLESKTPMPTDGNMEQITYGVRVFRHWRQTQGDSVEPRNVENLEADVEVVQTVLKSVLIEAGHDFFNVQSVTAIYDGQYVEAALLAFQRNMGARGG